MGFIIALLSGALMSIQGVFNTEVTKQTSVWVAAGWVQPVSYTHLDVYKRQFFHQGQICMCTSRLIVEEPVYDRFCEAFAAYARTMKVGDPHQKDTIIGPLIKQEQCQIIDSQIQDAVSKGAVLMLSLIHIY